MVTADTIKEMQRTDPDAKEQWHAYCDAYGEGVRDPARHELEFLAGFVSLYQSGARVDAVDNGLVKFIKLGQRKSAGWKAVWQEYCDSRKVPGGQSTHDPAKYGVDFLEGFFDYIGKRAVSPLLGFAMPPAGKRMRVDGPVVPLVGMGMGIAPIATVNSGASDLVAKVKAYQKTGESEKEQWHLYCDAHLNGIRDPARHDAAALKRFLASQGASNIATAGKPAQAQGAEALAFVSSIKAFQKSSPEAKEAWHAYCDSHLGGIRDPSRHAAETLRDFCAHHGLA
eukprot:TRINITY_DN83109_c0_g1_i1.p2 TRINITY_DN83109_c0_g1~~TRINITY_DN83109_c0_g1_i1.p2  ORF type:complete len:283 (+),score=60.19 TRINITY_DN83109_c0_g1_i1:85-933(+)